MMFGLRKKTAPAQAAGARVLAAARAASRNPALFGPGRIPDSFDGRYESIVLHAVMLHERLAKEGEFGQTACQAMFDELFEDFDAALREIGVGDLSVSKKIRKMGEGFYGRLSAYRDALAKEDDAALVEALERNVFATADAAPGYSERLAAYVRETMSGLFEQPVEEILAAGAPRWGRAPA